MSRSREQPDDRPPLGEIVFDPLGAYVAKIAAIAERYATDVAWLVAELAADPAAVPIAPDRSAQSLREKAREALAAATAGADVDALLDALGKQHAALEVRNPAYCGSVLRDCLLFKLDAALAWLEVMRAFGVDDAASAPERQLYATLRRICSDREALPDHIVPFALLLLEAGAKLGLISILTIHREDFARSWRVLRRARAAAATKHKAEFQEALAAELRARRRPDGTLPRGAVTAIARALAARFEMTEEAARRALHRTLSRRPAKRR